MKKYFYVSNLNDLRDYEKQNNNHISYRRLTDRVFNNMILCNEIIEQYPELLENFDIDYFYDENEENYSEFEIYQYFIVSGWDLTQVKEDYPNLLLEYLEPLDLWILGVTHFGTSWDYILTDLIATDDYKKAIED